MLQLTSCSREIWGRKKIVFLGTKKKAAHAHCLKHGKQTNKIKLKKKLSVAPLHRSNYFYFGNVLPCI